MSEVPLYRPRGGADKVRLDTCQADSGMLDHCRRAVGSWGGGGVLLREVPLYSH